MMTVFLITVAVFGLALLAKGELAGAIMQLKFFVRNHPKNSKAKAGLAVTQITQKAVELLGPDGYSKKLLVEKWMRDAKINDIYEGTQQINQLIVARRILDYSSSMLR